MAKKILIVDDHEALRKGLKLVFETAGQAGEYEVIEAADGSQALAKARENQPDVALVDVMLPEMDGGTLAAELRKIYPALPIAILTAKSDPETEAVVKAKCLPDKYLVKPMDNNVLISEIRELLHEGGQG